MTEWSKMSDQLVGLNDRVDWDAFLADLNRIYKKSCKSNA